MWVGIIQSSEGPKRTKRPRKGKFSLSSLDGVSFFCPWTSDPLVLGLLDSGSYTSAPLFLMPSDSDWIISLAYLILQLADGRPWVSLASIMAWVNAYNKSLICISICPVGSFSLENPMNTVTLCHLHRVSISPLDKINAGRGWRNIANPQVLYDIP